LYTDHSALLTILNKDNATRRIARWQLDLIGFDFYIHHVPGKNLGIADGLSRLRPTQTFNQLAGPKSEDLIAFTVETRLTEEVTVSPIRTSDIETRERGGT